MGSGFFDTTVVKAAREQISCDLAGEAVILSVKNGTYYGLDPVGARVWELLQAPRTLGEIRDRLLDEYDVDAERCWRELCDLLVDLKASELIELNDAEDSPEA